MCASALLVTTAQAQTFGVGGGPGSRGGDWEAYGGFRALFSESVDFEGGSTIDTDDDLGMMWGDCGLIYYWVEESAARAGDLGNAWLILQCS